MKTIEERASGVVAEIGRYSASSEIHALIRIAMEDLIEDASQFLDRQAAGFQVLIDHAPTQIRAEDLKRVKSSIELTAKEMRKRYGKENTHGDMRIAD